VLEMLKMGLLVIFTGCMLVIAISIAWLVFKEAFL